MNRFLLAVIIYYMAWLPCNAQNGMEKAPDTIYLIDKAGGQYPVVTQLLDSAKWASMADRALLPGTGNTLQQENTLLSDMLVQEHKQYYCVLPAERNYSGAHVPRFVINRSTRFSIMGLISGKRKQLCHVGRQWFPVAAWLPSQNELWLQVSDIKAPSEQLYCIRLQLPFDF